MKRRRSLLICLVLLSLFFLACNGAEEATTQPEAPAEESAAPPTQPPAEEPTAAPTAEPTAAPIGLNRSNPVPLNQAFTASNGAIVTMHGITYRGAEAAALVKNWNQFNDEPGEGTEFVIVSASFGYEGGDKETLEVSQWDFRAVVENAIVEIATMTGDDVLGGEVFEGGTVEGLLVFEVPTGSTDIVVIYTVLMEESYYFATQ